MSSILLVCAIGSTGASAAPGNADRLFPLDPEFEIFERYYRVIDEVLFADLTDTPWVRMLASPGIPARMGGADR